MLFKKVTYTSSSGKKLDARCEIAFLGSEDLKGWEWSWESDSDVALRKRREYAATIMFRGYNDIDAAKKAAATFLANCDKDVENATPGILNIEDWELSCFVSKGECLGMNNLQLAYKITIVSNDPVWRHTKTIQLFPEVSKPGETKYPYLDFPFDFDFDYSKPSINAQASNVQIGDNGALVRLTFFGQCTNPYVTFSANDGRAWQNTYGINYSVPAGFRAIIDPTKRKELGGSVYMLNDTGMRTNLYEYRRRGYEGSGQYVFQRLPGGSYSISYPQSYGVDIDLIEERGQLPWM